MGIPDHLTYLLRNLYVGQEELELDMEQELVQNWERSTQGCILSPYLFDWYEKHSMWNARLNDSQTGIKISGKHINNLRYADDTTLKAEIEDELKNLLIMVKEEKE